MPRARYSHFAALMLVVWSMLFGHAMAQWATARMELPVPVAKAEPVPERASSPATIVSSKPAPEPSKSVPLASPKLDEAALVKNPVDPTPKNYVPGGLMYIDNVLFKGQGFTGAFSTEALLDSQGTMEIIGWALDTHRRDAGSSVELVFASPSHMVVVPTERIDRPDLVHIHTNEKYKMGGFSARMGVESFQAGEYRLFVRITCTGLAGVQQLPTDRRFYFKHQGQRQEEF